MTGQGPACMPGCQQHSDDDECQIVVIVREHDGQLDEGLYVVLTGVRCDFSRVEIVDTDGGVPAIYFADDTIREHGQGHVLEYATLHDALAKIEPHHRQWDLDASCQSPEGGPKHRCYDELAPEEDEGGEEDDEEEDDEEEEGDDEPIICDECHQSVQSTWGVGDRWLCPECCAAAGISISRG